MLTVFNLKAKLYDILLKTISLASKTLCSALSDLRDLSKPLTFSPQYSLEQKLPFMSSYSTTTANYQLQNAMTKSTNLEIQQPIKVIVDHLGTTRNDNSQNDSSTHSLTVLSSENLSNSKRSPALYFPNCTAAALSSTQQHLSVQQSPLINQNNEVIL